MNGYGAGPSGGGMNGGAGGNGGFRSATPNSRLVSTLLFWGGGRGGRARKKRRGSGKMGKRDSMFKHEIPRPNSPIQIQGPQHPALFEKRTRIHPYPAQPRAPNITSRRRDMLTSSTIQRTILRRRPLRTREPE